MIKSLINLATENFELKDKTKPRAEGNWNTDILLPEPENLAFVVLNVFCVTYAILASKIIVSNKLLELLRLRLGLGFVKVVTINLLGHKLSTDERHSSIMMVVTSQRPTMSMR